MSTALKYTGSIWFSLPNNAGVIEFTARVLNHFSKYQQIKPKDKEAGGQLFYEFSSKGHKRVVLATGPRLTDRRTRTSYKPSLWCEQREIDRLYKKKLYWLGDWHTHPEAKPKPSNTDVRSVKEIFKRTKNPGPGILMVVIGTKGFPAGMSVSWCNNEVELLLP